MPLLPPCCVQSARLPVWTVIFAIVLTIATSQNFALAQQSEFKQFSATSVFQELDAKTATSQRELVTSWWDQHVTNSFRSEQPLEADIHTLLYLALQHSNQIKIAKRDPLIRETAIQEADSNFDWVRYLNSAWNDTSEPIGNTLTAGGTASRFNDNVFQGTGGLRRLTRYGGLLDISQRFGWQDNNSVFLIPDRQATSQLTVSYTQPLLRGRGAGYNNSMVFLARIDAKVAEHEFMATLQDELLEVTRSYWALYLERAALAHQMRLFLKTKQIYKTLDARQRVDTQRTQLITAASALENRRADLIRARTAVTNAETRLRGLINAPELANSDEAELIPAEIPSVLQFGTDLQSELQTAIQNRPEIMAAVQQVKSGSTRLGIARHEMLPALNLVTQGYANGLRGDNDFPGAFGDQFTTGRPSYSVGVQYEMPVGNRLAKSRLCRRQHELARLQDEYGRALEAVQTEVDIAVRELNTSYMEIGAKSRALAAAEAEASTIEQRWLRMVDGNGSAALNLESLLRAQERVTASERDYMTSVLTYNLAMINLKRANGTLLQSENVSVNIDCENGCKSIDLAKGDPSNSSFAEEGFASEDGFADPGVVEQGFVEPGAIEQGVPTAAPPLNEFVPSTTPVETIIVPTAPQQLPQHVIPSTSTPQGNASPDYFRK